MSKLAERGIACCGETPAEEQLLWQIQRHLKILFMTSFAMSRRCNGKAL
jgi:hypothetical protein